MTGGSVTFDDGTSYLTQALPNNGSGYWFPVDGRLTSSLLFEVSSVSSSTGNVGLSEFVVLGSYAGNATGPSLLNGTSAVAAPDWTHDVALLATASASSYTDQPPQNAINALLGGYTEDGTGDEAAEWSSDGEGAGAWLRLDWTTAVQITAVILYDRPNLDVSAFLSVHAHVAVRPF